jgi:hypothetical protein
MMIMERNTTKAIAMYIDSQNSPNVPIQDVPWINARLTGTFRWGAGGGFNGW